MQINEIINEEWSQKYKNSINCSHPKGFSQKAHCAGKKKHNENIEIEMTCPDCGMCQTHGSIMEIKKGQKDSNGYTKCWPGKHAEGTKKGKNGGQVRNCVPNESVNETDNEHDNFTPADLKSLERIRDLSTLKARAKELIKGKISFNDVKFSYPSMPEKLILTFQNNLVYRTFNERFVEVSYHVIYNHNRNN